MNEQNDIILAILSSSIFTFPLCIFLYAHWFKKKKKIKALIMKGKADRYESSKELDKDLLRAHLIAGLLLFLWFMIFLRFSG